MTVDSFRTELNELIDDVFIHQYGGRATKSMVHLAVQQSLPEHLIDYLVGKGLGSELSSYFRTKGADGLPRYPEVNDAGEHVQLELLSVSELKFMRVRYLDRSAANADQAEKVRARCLALHGVDLAALAVVS